MENRAKNINHTIKIFKDLKEDQSVVFEKIVSHPEHAQVIAKEYYTFIQNQVLELHYNEYILIELDKWIELIDVQLSDISNYMYEYNFVHEENFVVSFLNNLNELLKELKVVCLEKEFDVFEGGEEELFKKQLTVNQYAKLVQVLSLKESVFGSEKSLIHYLSVQSGINVDTLKSELNILKSGNSDIQESEKEQLRKLFSDIIENI